MCVCMYTCTHRTCMAQSAHGVAESMQRVAQRMYRVLRAARSMRGVCTEYAQNDTQRRNVAQSKVTKRHKVFTQWHSAAQNGRRDPLTSDTMGLQLILTKILTSGSGWTP